MMSSEISLPSTQRAYTLRLTGTNKEDTTWRDWLWRTHEAVNRGAKAFGDWLLTLRGGIDHTVADGDPSQRQDRRIILALSWLSVESADGAPPAFIVPHTRDDAGVRRDWRTVEALREILRTRGVAGEELESWVADCQPSLEAAIRSDAVWVNRSRAFDAATEQTGPSLNREEVWDLLERFFGSREAYFAAVGSQEDEEQSTTAGDERSKDLVQKARGWLSNRFGSGAGSDFGQVAKEYRCFAAWCGWADTHHTSTPQELLQQLAVELGQASVPDRLASTPGPPNRVQTNFRTIVAALQAGSQPMSINLGQVAAEAINQAEAKEDLVGRKGERPWASRMLEDVEKACGFEFSPPSGGQDRINEFSVMLDHAARRVPRTKQNAVDTSIRRVGGLSLTRLATIRALYQVMRAYRMRPEPEDLRKNIPGRGDDRLARFGQSILDALERLRENRVKQLASRLAAAALGLGKELKAQSDARFSPCHAVVIENLTNYRPEDRRTRRENRQLMNWSSAKVKKYLVEACQLHGLHLREVPAAYTSRQDARTGAPGIRCEDVPVREFLKVGGYWQREIVRARAHLDQGAAVVSAYDRLLLDSATRWEKRPESEWKRARPLRLPRRGGEVFVSTRMEPYVGHEGRIRFPFTQADLNAAANIGLRALLDPDWTGRWWYVPCLPAPSHIPLEDRTRGSVVIEPGRPLPTDAGQDSQASTAPVKTRGSRRRRADGQERRAVNLWRDPVAGVSLSSSTWQATKEYWDNVAITVITQILRPCCCLTSEPVPLVSADESPF